MTRFDNDNPLGEEIVCSFNPELAGQSGVKFAMCGEPLAPCEHDFQGWRSFEDGNGGEQVCAKCGIGALAYSLTLDI